MQPPSTKKPSILVGNVQIEEDSIRKFLKGEEGDVRNVFTSIKPILDKIIQNSKLIDERDPTVNTINSSVKVIIDYVIVLENCIIPIPKGLPPQELLTNRDVITRTTNRNRIKNMRINGFIASLKTTTNGLEYLVRLYNDPNIGSIENKIDNTDKEIITTSRTLVTHFEHFAGGGSGLGTPEVKLHEGHGYLLPLYGKPKGNIDKDILIELEKLYDDVQNFTTLAEDLFVPEEDSQ